LCAADSCPILEFGIGLFSKLIAHLRFPILISQLGAFYSTVWRIRSVCASESLLFIMPSVWSPVCLARKMSRGPMHSSVFSNHLPIMIIQMLVSWLHSESARACKNCAPSDTRKLEPRISSVLMHRLLVMAQPANSSSLLQLVTEPPTLINLSVCRE